jgi:hypothetical protein
MFCIQFINLFKTSTVPDTGACQRRYTDKNTASTSKQTHTHMTAHRHINMHMNSLSLTQLWWKQVNTQTTVTGNEYFFGGIFHGFPQFL